MLSYMAKDAANGVLEMITMKENKAAKLDY